jgi:hypothetical protein
MSVSGEMLDKSVGMAEFLCECSRTDCTEIVPLELAEYERVRSQPNQFVITPGHAIPNIEKVVWESDRYFLVRKINGAEYAERTDPRKGRRRYERSPRTAGTEPAELPLRERTAARHRRRGESGRTGRQLPL